MNNSLLQGLRHGYAPKLPPLLRRAPGTILSVEGAPTEAVSDRVALKQLFGYSYGKPILTFAEGRNPYAGERRTVGVLLSGGQAPGGHNVIAGLFDRLRSANPASRLLGFLKGPGGLLDDRFIELSPAFVDEYRNTGGFDMIGSGRDKIETDSQFKAAQAVCNRRGLDALVIIGGDDSNTNAALLSEYFMANRQETCVIGVPKTIDGDLKNDWIETSFGFDSAVKTYSELIGNLCRDANSAKKYWHFIKLMGRSASHIALECALQTQPNLCIISEEVHEKQMTLRQIVEGIAEVICQRANQGDNFGILLIPEGLIESIPEMGRLIGELNSIMSAESSIFAHLKTFEAQSEFINKKLSVDASYVFSSLPNEIQRQLLMDRDPHGNVQVSRIETEQLLLDLVAGSLMERRADGRYSGSFSAVKHFFGYEGRCAFPSNFDADYCYSLGQTACELLLGRVTGYLAAVGNVARPAEHWEASGIPITMMMHLEQRHGTRKPVIRKALVNLQGAPFKHFASRRDKWAIETDYRYPGAIQYWGPDELCNRPTITLELERYFPSQ